MPLQWRNQIWQSLEEGAESDVRSVVHSLNNCSIATFSQHAALHVVPSWAATFTFLQALQMVLQRRVSVLVTVFGGMGPFADTIGPLSGLVGARHVPVSLGMFPLIRK